jgi:hypothetical protein
VTVGSILKEESTGDWETKCTLLLWLSILVLIPFDMASVDTAMVEPRASNAGREEEQTPPLVQRMVKLCTEHLSNPGPTREMTGVLLSRLLTRPDMQGTLKGYNFFCLANTTFFISDHLCSPSLFDPFSFYLIAGLQFYGLDTSGPCNHTGWNDWRIFGAWHYWSSCCHL